MPTVQSPPAEPLLSLSQTAMILDIDKEEVSQALVILDTKPVATDDTPCVTITDLLTLAILFKGTPVEEAAGGALEILDAGSPEYARTKQLIDAFFDDLPERKPTPPAQFLKELHQILPPAYARRAEKIYLNVAKTDHEDRSRRAARHKRT